MHIYGAHNRARLSYECTTLHTSLTRVQIPPATSVKTSLSHPHGTIIFYFHPRQRTEFPHCTALSCPKLLDAGCTDQTKWQSILRPRYRHARISPPTCCMDFFFGNHTPSQAYQSPAKLPVSRLYHWRGSSARGCMETTWARGYARSYLTLRTLHSSQLGYRG